MRNFFKKSGSPKDDGDEDFASGVLDAAGSDASAPQTPKRTLRPEERLRSVVSESDPGTALDLLAANKRFIIPGAVEVVGVGGEVEIRGDAYAVLILPTQGSFGGLSKKMSKKNRGDEEAKGSFISALNADTIHAVVTEELLDEDTLAIIPDAESLANMEEFGILREANFSWGAVMQDVESGGLVIFEVPGLDMDIDPETGSFTQKLLEVARQVESGVKDLEDVVPVSLIAAMCELYFYGDDTETGQAYGAEGLAQARAMNMEAVISGLADGEYPSEGAMLASVVETFPVLAATRFGDYAPDAEGVGGPDTAVMPAVDDDADEPVDVDGETLAEASTDDYDDEVAADADVDDAADDAVAEDAFEEPDFGDMGDGDDFDDDVADVPEEPMDDAVDDEEAADGGDGDASAQETSAPSPIETASGSGMDSRVLEALDRMDEAIERLSESHIDRNEFYELLGSGGYGPEGPSMAQMAASDDSEYGLDEVQQAAVLKLANEELGLQIDLSHFASTVAYPPYVLLKPSGVKHTEWLNEQLEALIVARNGHLQALNQEAMMDLQQSFVAFSKLSVQEIEKELDYSNPETSYGRVYQAIQNDDAELKTKTHDAVGKTRAEMEKERAQVKHNWVEARIAGLEQEWERANGPSWERKIERKIREIENYPEAMRSEKMAQMLSLRKTEARKIFDEQILKITQSMQEMREKARQREHEFFVESGRMINDFINEQAQNDIHYADVTERKLAADNRVEALQKEAAAEVEAIRRESQAFKEELTQRMHDAAAEHREQLKLRDDNARVKVENAEQEVAEIRARMEKAEKAHREELVRQEELVAKIAEDSETEAKRHDEAIRRSERDAQNKTKMQIVLLVVVALVALFVGAIATAVFLPGMLT